MNGTLGKALALLASLALFLLGPRSGAATQSGELVTLVLGGDVALSRVRRGRRAEIAGARQLRALQPWFQGAAFGLVNLEGPLCTEATWERVRRRAPARPCCRFRGPLAAARWFADASISALGLANNHALDCGAEGLEETAAALDEAGLLVVGLGRGEPGLHEQRVSLPGGRTLAVLAASDRYNRGELRARGGALRPQRVRSAAFRSVLRRAVRRVAAEPDVDLLLVSLHWGREGEAEPCPEQRALAGELRSLGAAIVIGHHAHVVQGLAVSGDGLVAYGLGNLLFDQRGELQRIGALLRVELDLSREPAQRLRTAELSLLERDAQGLPRPIGPLHGPAQLRRVLGGSRADAGAFELDATLLRWRPQRQGTRPAADPKRASSVEERTPGTLQRGRP